MDDDAPDTVPQRAQIIAGRYRILRGLGSGGMGQVFEAEHVHTTERLAFKVMIAGQRSDELVERFRREARASAKIASEHVVKVVDADVAPELGNRPFIVMELLEGKDLGEHLVDEKRLSPAEVKRILDDVGRGVQRAHEVGIVHRDLKPQNIFLHTTKEGRSIAKVLDFGLAHTLDPEVTRITRTGEPIGTPLYMSPEQVGAKKDVGIETDIWALGMIAFELLTGEAYWQAQTLVGLLSQIRKTTSLDAPTTRDAGLPAGFDGWFLRSCAPSPQDRFASVKEQIEALDAILEPPARPRPADEPVPPAPARATTVPSANRRRRRPPVVTVLGIVLVAGLVGLAIIGVTILTHEPAPLIEARPIPSAPPLASVPSATVPPSAIPPVDPLPPEPVAAPAPTTAAPARSATLIVFCTPTCTLYIDGRSYGNVAEHKVVLPPGRHMLVLAVEIGGRTTVRPNETVDLAPGTITTKRWAF